MKYRFFFLFLLLFSTLSFAQSSLDSLRMVMNIGHSNHSIEASYSPNKRFIVTFSSKDYGGTDFSLRIWDLKSGKLLKVLNGHTKEINSAKFSPNSNLIITSSDDETSRIWEVSSGKELYIQNRHKGSVNSAEFSPDGILFLTGSTDSTLCVFETSTFKLQRLINCQGEIQSAQFIENGKRIKTITGSIFDFEKCKVILWNLNDGGIYRSFNNHVMINKSFISPNGKFITTSSWNHTFIWEIVTGRLIASFKGSIHFFSTDSKRCIYLLNGKLGVFDINSGLTNTKINYSPNTIVSAHFCENENLILLTLNDHSIRVWDLIERRELQVLKGHEENINSVESIKNSSVVISAADDFTSRIWNIKNGECIAILGGINITGENKISPNNCYLSSFQRNSFSIQELGSENIVLSQTGNYFRGVFSKDNSFFVTLGGNRLSKINFWDLDSKKNNFQITEKKPVIEISLCNNDRYILLRSERFVSVWDLKVRKEIYKIKTDAFIISAVTLPESEFFYIQLVNKNGVSVKIYSLISGVEVLEFLNKDAKFNSLEIDKKGQNVLLSYDDGTARIWDIASGESMKIFKGHSNKVFKAFFIADDKKILTFGADKTIRLWDFETEKMISYVKFDYTKFNTILLSKNEDFFLTVELEELLDITLGSLVFWSAKNGGKLYSIENMGVLNQIVISDKENIISTLSNDGFELNLFDMMMGTHLLKRYQLSSENYLVKLPNSPYYMCSKDASKMLHYVTPSLKVIGFEQLDPVYNRPDIVLDSIGKYFGGADQELVANYRQSWEKRIDRLGLNKEKLGKGEIAVPSAEIVGTDAIAYENKAGKINIKVSANDPKYPLRRFNVFVNEVPLYGSAGISIAHLKKQVWDTTVSVPLSVGENKIQVSVMNELGLENFKYPTYVNYTPENNIIAKTHYIGIGVNAFQDSIHNLKYCVKDVRDLAREFATENKNVDTLLFTDKQVTKENILALKEYLNKTNVNDKVIISCSSHGLLDDSLNFYLAMHDVDFNNPKARGLKYEELESLLDGIPARQKLLLLDACNSGENDKTELMKRDLAKNQNKMDEKAIEGAKGVIIKLEEENKSNFKKMNELFVNVRNNTGSVIISAAGGQESALEGDLGKLKINNGAFTYSILEYLEKYKNDKNELTVNKLKQYVEKRVEEITNGKQKPTSRQETMEVDWGVKR